MCGKRHLCMRLQVKRLRATTGGSLVGLVAETLEGLPLVQAYRHESSFQHVRSRDLWLNSCACARCACVLLMRHCAVIP